MVACHMGIEYENDCKQIDRLRRELDQTKSRMAKKDEQLKKLQNTVVFCRSEVQLSYLLKLGAFCIPRHRNANLEWLQKCGNRTLMERVAMKCGQRGFIQC